MVRIEFVPEVFEDFERFRQHLEAHGVDAQAISQRIRWIIAALRILETSPEMGRPAGGSNRELVIGSRGSGYVVLYRYAPELQLVLVLAARQQRENSSHR